MDSFRLKIRNFREQKSNFLSNKSKIQIERYKVCGGTNKLPNAKKRIDLPSKLRPVKIFKNFQNFMKR